MNPFQRLMHARRGHALPTSADIKRHEEREIVVSVGRKGERCEARFADVDSQLLAKFTDQSVFRPLARFYFSARKFPEIGQCLSHRSLRDQHPAIGIDQRARGHKDQWMAGLLHGRFLRWKWSKR